jgi:flagellar protein FliS
MNMRAFNQFGASAYANVGLESGVASANPHRLVLMLFEGALVAIGKARQAVLTGDIESRGRAISKAIQIIEEGLVVALDPAGGQLAEQLRSLYQYMAARLLMAALKNDVSAIDEVTRLLGDIRDAWKSIDPRGTSTAANPATGLALAA